MRFVSNYSNLTLVLENTIAGKSPGMKIEFKDGVYETSNLKEIKAIRKNKLFGVHILEHEDAPIVEQKEPRKKPEKQVVI